MSAYNKSPIACIGLHGSRNSHCSFRGQNVSNGYAIGVATSELHAVIFAAGSAAGAVLQPVSFFAAWLAFKRWQIGRAVIALTLGFACLSFAVLSSLGFVSSARTDAKAARLQASDMYQISRAQADAALAELKATSAPLSNKKAEAKRIERRTTLEATIERQKRGLPVEGEGQILSTASPNPTKRTTWCVFRSTCSGLSAEGRSRPTRSKLMTLSKMPASWRRRRITHMRTCRSTKRATTTISGLPRPLPGKFRSTSHS